MKIIALEKLVEAADKCKIKFDKETDFNKKELYSKAYAEITDVILDIVENDSEVDIE
jgi:hypothetical protein